MSPTPPATDLRSQAARGVIWTGGGQVLRQVLQVGGQLVLVRLLTPDDFGVLGMAMFFVGIGQLLADFGIGSAIVQARSDDPLLLSSCFWLNVAIACLMALTVLVCAPAIAIYFKRQDVALVVAVLSANLLLAGLLVMPTALLNRDMRFAELAQSQVLGSLAGAVLAITLAWLGAGVWALVAQPLIGSTANLLWAWRAARWMPSLTFSWVRVAPVAKFSLALLGTNLVGYANRNADSLLIGRTLGAGPLGFYAMAIQLMLYPLQQVSSVIVRVLFPTLVQIKDDLPRMRAAYLKGVATIAMVTFPVMGGLFALADDFVQVVFGPTWVAMTPLLKVLAWVGMMQSVGTTVGTIYLSTGRPRVALQVTLIGAPVLIGGMAAGLHWGVLGVAIGYAVASFGFFYFTLIKAFDLIGLKLIEFHRAVSGPAVATATMIVGLLLTMPALTGMSGTLRLVAGVLLGTLGYVGASMVFNRALLLEILATLRGLRR